MGTGGGRDSISFLRPSVACRLHKNFYLSSFPFPVKRLLLQTKDKSTPYIIYSQKKKTRLHKLTDLCIFFFLSSLKQNLFYPTLVPLFSLPRFKCCLLLE